MKRGEQTYKWNGEYWYRERQSIPRRIAKWFVWIGGSWNDPAPVSILGHRATYYSWGFQVRLGRNAILVVAWRPKDEGLRIYISADGTPKGAYVWYAGAPFDVRQAANDHDALVERKRHHNAADTTLH